jgi:hypothetical protein
MRITAVVSIIVILGVIVMPLIILSVYADNTNPGVFSIDSKPYGIPYADWSAKWEQWLISMPTQVNAATDPTGKNCAQNQNGPVWFLAGTSGGSAERTCTIPIGKAILFPIINSECSYADTPSVKSESALVTCAQQDPSRATNLQASVDGVTLQQLAKYRVTSPLFTVTYPPNNLFGAPVGTTQMVADGFYVFLQPLSSGKHEIQFSGITPGDPTTGTANFAINTIYHITVQ